jgi:hypothetical protein
VAVGFEWAGSDFDAAVRTSPDGVTWSRVPRDNAVFGGAGNQEMRSVTVGGPGLVAVGVDGPGDDQDAAVWTSPDGVTWSRVPYDEAVFGGAGDQEMYSVTAGGSGLVAVGWAGPIDGHDAAVWTSDAAVWTSRDGVTWSRVPHDEAVFGGAASQEMRSVTAGGPGLVAVGYSGPGAEYDAAVWVQATED